MKKGTQNFILALILVISIISLFYLIVLKELGGTEALFAILGHVAAWGEIAVFYYFRKKPKEDNAQKPTEDVS